MIPLSPYTRCPIILGLGKPREEPVVRDGQVKVGKVFSLSITFDHRYADGAQGALVMRRFQKIFARPGDYRSVFDEEEASKEG